MPTFSIFYTLGDFIILTNDIRITNYYGIVIRKESFIKQSIGIDKLNEVMESTPLDQNDFLVSYGPSFGKEASDEFIRRLEKIGLKYFDDFFVFEGNYPEWISFKAQLN